MIAYPLSSKFFVIDAVDSDVTLPLSELQSKRYPIEIPSFLEASYRAAIADWDQGPDSMCDRWSRSISAGERELQSAFVLGFSIRFNDAGEMRVYPPRTLHEFV